MKAFSKATILLLSAVFVLGSFGLASGQNVYVDVNEIEGLVDGMIPEGGADLVIPVRFTNAGEARSCISNGFHFTSEGITFDSIEGAWNANYPWDLEMAMALMQFPMFFDVGLFINYFDNGVGFAGLSNSGSGLPLGFDDVAYYITLEGVQGDYGGTLTMDSSFWMPANVWLWCGEPTVYPEWGGPYTFELCCPGPTVSTNCWPQPTKLIMPMDDRILGFYIYNEYRADEVDLNSVRVNNIPPYTEARVEYHDIITDVSLMRFLGASGFRPIPPEGVQSTYTVTYNYTDGTSAMPVYGDYVLEVFQGDVTLDGMVDINDVQFMSDYFWAKGPKCEFEEFMDVDGNGQLDIRDALKLIEIVEF